MHTISIANALTVVGILFSLAAVVIAIILTLQKRNQSRIELLRAAIERGTSLDDGSLTKLLSSHPPAPPREPLPRGRGALVAGIIVISFGVGYGILGYCIFLIAPAALFPMMGIACLFCCCGMGLMIVSKALQ